MSRKPAPEPNQVVEGAGILVGNGARILFGLVVVTIVAVIFWPAAIVVAFILLLLFGHGEEKRRLRRAEQRARWNGGQP